MQSDDTLRLTTDHILYMNVGGLCKSILPGLTLHLSFKLFIDSDSYDRLCHKQWIYGVIVYNRQGNVNNNHVIIEYDFGFVVIIYQGYLYFWHCITGSPQVFKVFKSL